jgi:hypothetical protein
LYFHPGISTRPPSSKFGFKRLRGSGGLGTSLQDPFDNVLCELILAMVGMELVIGSIISFGSLVLDVVLLVDELDCSIVAAGSILCPMCQEESLNVLAKLNSAR